jgi:hypothetical protein
MNNSTLDEQFLDRLTNEQKGVLWHYYRLLNTPSTSIDDEVKQIEQIWGKAESDPTLYKWLELIDYFYTNVSELESELESEFNDNRRSQYSEHLDSLLEQKLNPNIKENNQPSTSSKKGEFVAFLCPDNSGLVQLPITESIAVTLAAFSEKLCNRCHEKLGDHKVISVGELYPR